MNCEMKYALLFALAAAPLAAPLAAQRQDLPERPVAAPVSRTAPGFPAAKAGKPALIFMPPEGGFYGAAAFFNRHAGQADNVWKTSMQQNLAGRLALRFGEMRAPPHAGRLPSAGGYGAGLIFKLDRRPR